MDGIAAEKFGNNNKISLTKDNGVLKTIKKQGNPQSHHPLKGDTVFVNYVGTLKESGDVFDSSRDKDEPFRFTIGRGQVIKAWDIGVSTMHQGEIATFECQSEYAYGKSGSPPKIPADATLIFEVELIRWEGEDLSPERDGSIMKSTIVDGEKYNTPSENASVTVHAIGECKGQIFYDRELSFILGEGSEEKLPEGVDRSLRRITKGEKCRVVLKGSQFTYGPNPPSGLGLEPNSEIVFTLFLKDFEKIKQSWELLDCEKLDVAKQSKERGTLFLSQGKYQLALSKYNSIVLLLEHARPTDSEDKNIGQKFEDMFVSALLNCALVHLKLGENAECIKSCDRVLEKTLNNVKALYRKAQALQNRKDFDDAILIYQRVIEIEPDNKAAKQQVMFCKDKVAEQLNKERRLYAGLFGKLSKGNSEP